MGFKMLCVVGLFFFFPQESMVCLVGGFNSMLIFLDGVDPPHLPFLWLWKPVSREYKVMVVVRTSAVIWSFF